MLAGSVEVTFVAEDGTQAVASIGRGNELTFDPETITFDAPATNVDTIVIMVEDKQISVASGEQAQLKVQISPLAPTATPAAVSPQPALTPVPEIAPSDDGLGGGAISAITIAILVVLSLIGGIIYSFVRRSKE